MLFMILKLINPKKGSRINEKYFYLTFNFKFEH